MDINLTIKQTEAWQCLSSREIDEVLFGGGAGAGKSWFGCLWIATNCIMYKGTRNGIGRKTMRSLIDTTHITMLGVLKDFLGLVEGRDFEVKLGSLEKGIKFSNGSWIPYKDLTYKPSDPTVSTLGSQLYTNFFIDEADEVAKVVKDTLSLRTGRHMNAEYGLYGKLLMTCNPSDNHLKSEFYTPWIEGTLDSNKAFIPALADDNPYLDEDYKIKVANSNGITGKRYRGDWDFNDGDNNLFPKESIKLIFSGKKLESERKYITCDVARKGKDLSIILVWDGFNVIDVKTYETNTTKELADEIVKTQKQYDVGNGFTIIDEDGIGGGVVDLIQRVKGFNANGKVYNSENYKNLKSQCYHHIANLPESFRFIYKGTVKGRNMHDYVKQELSAIQEEWSEGKIGITKKDKIKASIGRSPDFADAIALRAYFELAGGSVYR